MKLTPYPPANAGTVPLCAVCHRAWEADAPARQAIADACTEGIPTVVPLTSDCVPLAVLRVELAGDAIDICGGHASWWARALDLLEQALVDLQPVEWDAIAQSWRIVRREQGDPR